MRALPSSWRDVKLLDTFLPEWVTDLILLSPLNEYPM